MNNTPYEYETIQIRQYDGDKMTENVMQVYISIHETMGQGKGLGVLCKTVYREEAMMEDIIYTATS